MFRKAVWLVVFCVCAVSSLHAQVTTIINTGTAGTAAHNAGPIYRSSASSSYDASRFSYLYTQAELAAAGIFPGSTITALGWTKANNATTTGGGIFRIYMKNSTAAAFAAPSETWANLNSGAQLVYENLNQSIPATTAPAYIPFQLTTPFNYTGGSIEVSTEWDINQVSGNPSSAAFSWLWSTVPDRIYGRTETALSTITTLSSTTNTINTLEDRRPFLELTYLPGAACTSPPTAGTASASQTANACVGSAINLTLTGNSIGSGQTYQWQFSTDPTFATSAPVGSVQSSAALTTIVNGPGYYRAAVTCGTATSYSAAVQVTVAYGMSGTYTINSTLAPSATNFQSFGAAVTAMTSGCGVSGPVVFNVAPNSGPYTEQVIIPQIQGASSANTITFNCNDNELNFSPSVSAQRAVLKLDGASFLRFKRLRVVGTGTAYGFGIQMLNNADNNLIDSCTVVVDSVSTSTNFTAIAISGSATSASAAGSDCDSVTISNTSVSGGYYGITMAGNASSVSQGCSIVNCSARNFYLYGIYVTNQSNGTVRNNLVERPTRTAVSTFYGVYVGTGCIGVRVDANTVRHPFGGAPTATSAAYGLYTAGDATAASPNVFSNNRFYNFVSNGTQYGIYNTGSPYSQYYHNTIALTDQAGTTADTRAFHQTSTAAGIELRNNIFVVTRAGAVRYGLYYNTAATPVIASNNLYYINGTGGADFVGYAGGVDYAALASWQGATSQDSNSYFANPVFVNEAAGNLTPTNTVDNLGRPVGIVTDANGLTRSATTPDVGALEFAVPACTTPIVVGTTNTTAATVCAGTLVQLSLSGNSVGQGQTYQWQSSSTANGPFTNLGTAGILSAYNITPNTSLYYRALVTCGTATATSAPVQVVARNPLSGSYTINSAIPQSATNFNSFNDVVVALQCGVTGPVTINVAAGSGPYNERVVLVPVAGASAANMITINGNATTLTFSAGASAERATLLFDGADYFRINNLNITGTGATYAYAVHFTNDANNNIIHGCRISAPTTGTGTGLGGIIFSGSLTGATTSGHDCDSNTISNNLITGGYYGITSGPASTAAVRVSGNRFINNTIQDFYYYGIDLDGHRDLLIEGNDISRPTRTTVMSTTYQINLSDVHNARISKNRLHDPNLAATSTPTSYAIAIAASDPVAAEPNIFSNNLIYNFNGAGTVYGFYNSSSDNAHYYYNSISLEDPNQTGTGITRGFYQTTLATGIIFRNNVVSVVRGGTGAKHAIYKATATSAVTSNNNVFYLSAGGTTSGIGYQGGNQATLAAWQTTTSQDAASIEVNPLFQAPATGNLTPTEATAGGIGAPVPVTTDVLGNARSANAPDPGAYEWPSAPCNPPTALTATNITATGASLGWAAVPGITGYEYVVDQAPGIPLNAGTTTTSNSASATGLQGNTIYYLHVRINCGSTQSAWATIAFTTLCPQAPAGLAASGITTTGANLSWTAMPGAVGYQYAVSTSSTPPASGTATTGLTFNPTGLTPNTTYYLHVRTACSGTNFSTWSTLAFTTACPNTSNLEAVAITAGTATVNWAAVPGAGGYEYAVTTSATPPAAGTITTQNTANVTGLTAVTQYYLHVRVRCSATNLSGWLSFPFMTACLNAVSTAPPGGPTTFCQGGSVVLTANSGTGLTYQWIRNNTDIPGATGATHVVNISGDYAVRVRTSPQCSTISAEVPVTVVATPVAIIQPSPAFVCAGSTLTLAATSPAPGYTYQWNLGGNLLPGAVASSLALATPGAYSLTVTNAGLCSLTSQVRNITLSDPQLTALVPGSVCGFGPVTLSATPTPGASVRWFAGPTAAFPLATGNSFVTPPLGATTAYYVSATEGFAIAGPASPASLNTALTTTAAAAAYTSFNVTSALNLLSVDVFPAAGVPIGTPASIEIRDAASALIATVPYTTTVTGGARQTVAMNVSLLPGTGYRIKQGTAIALMAASGGATYPYTAANLNITGQSVTASPSQYLGFYNWQLASGCEGPRQLIQAVVDPGPGAVISPAGPVAVCEGSSVSLQATSGGGSGLSYQWYLDGAQLPGATAAAYVASTAGAYQVRVGTTGGCQTLSDTVRVSVRALPVPVVSVSGGGTYLSTGVYDAYQWYRNGVALSGTVGQHHPAANDGQYTVRVRDNGGCYGTSAAVTVSALSVGGAAQSVEVGVQVYPNPARGEVWVSMVGGGALEARLSAMDGRVLVRGRSKAGAGALRLEMGSLAAGAYMVNVYNGEGKLLRIVQITKVE